MAKPKDPTTWLIYPRRSFIICRTLQVLISLAFLILNFIAGFSRSDSWVYQIGLVSWSPLNISSFLVYLSTLLAYLSNPTRLSRVLDPHNQKSRSPIPPLPNTPNLSRRGATLSIVIIEFLIILYCLGGLIIGAIMGTYDGEYSWCDYDYDYGYSNEGGEGNFCKTWLWGNVVLGSVVMGLLGIVTFSEGVKVYRAGWRESCRREVEKEILDRMSTEQGQVVVEPGESGERSIELGRMPFGYGHGN